MSGEEAKVAGAREARRVLPEVTIRMLLPPALRRDGGGRDRQLAEPVRLLVPLARDGRDAVLRVLPGGAGVEAAVLAWAGRLLADEGPSRVRVWCGSEGLRGAVRAMVEGLPVEGLGERVVVGCFAGELGEGGALVVLVGEEDDGAAWVAEGGLLAKAVALAGEEPLQVILPAEAELGGVVEGLVALGRSPIWKDLVPWGKLRVRPVLPVRNTPYPAFEALAEGVARELGRPEEEGDRAVVLVGKGGPAVPIPRGSEGVVQELTGWMAGGGGEADEAIWVGGLPTAAELVRAGWRTGGQSERGPFVTVLAAEPVGLLWAVAVTAALARGEVGAVRERGLALGEVLEAGAGEVDEDRAAFGLIADWGMNRGNALAVVRWMRAHRARVPYRKGGGAVVVEAGEVSGVWVEAWEALDWLREQTEAPEGSVFMPHGCWVPDAGWGGWHALVGREAEVRVVGEVPPMAQSAVFGGRDLRSAIAGRAALWKRLEVPGVDLKVT